MTSNSSGPRLLHHPAWICLFLLMGIDLVFISLHLANTFLPGPHNPMLNIEKEAGYSEMFQYMKYFIAGVLMTGLAIKLKTPNYLAWAFLFFYLLADDSLGFHEQLGGLIAAHMTFQMPMGLRQQDLGELLVGIATAMALCMLLFLAFRQGSADFRLGSSHLLALVMLLGGFGVVIDFLHMMVQSGWKLKFILALLEDGGEMLASSLILAYVLFLWLNRGVPANFACEKLMHLKNSATSAEEA